MARTGGATRRDLGLRARRFGPAPAAVAFAISLVAVSAMAAGAGAQTTAGSITVDPSSLTFGTQAPGSTSPAQKVTLASTGPQGTLNAESITGEFQISGGTCANGFVVSINSSCTVLVVFAPTSAGAKNESVTLVVDRTGYPVRLQGTAVTTTTTTTTVVPDTTTSEAPTSLPEPGTPVPATTATTPARSTTTEPSGSSTTSETSTTTTEPTAPASTSTTGGGPASTVPRGGNSPTLRATAPDGRGSGPPGVGLAVRGTGYPPRRGQALGLAAPPSLAQLDPCGTVYFFLGGSRLGSAHPDERGAVSNGTLSVPGDVRPGAHPVTSSCRSSGTPQLVSTEFVVTDASLHRAAFATSLPRPEQVSYAADDLLLSLFGVLGLLLLIAFPAELFNTTLEEHYDEVRGWFHLRPRRRPAGGAGGAALCLVFLAASGPLWFVMQPHFALDRSTLVAALGLSLATTVVTFSSDLPTLLHLRRRYHEGAAIVALPGSLVVALACVALSRAVHFQPGYFYGLVAGVAFARRLRAETAGRLAAMSAAMLLALSIAAWVATLPVSSAARQPSAGLAPILLENFLGGLFWVALDSLVIALLPLRLLEGSKIVGWSRAAWALLYAVALLAFVHILLRPTSGYVSNTAVTPAIVVVGLFIGFACISFAFWGYFRFRPPRPVAAGVPEAQTP